MKRDRTKWQNASCPMWKALFELEACRAGWTAWLSEVTKRCSPQCPVCAWVHTATPADIGAHIFPCPNCDRELFAQRLLPLVVPALPAALVPELVVEYVCAGPLTPPTTPLSQER